MTELPPPLAADVDLTIPLWRKRQSLLNRAARRLQIWSSEWAALRKTVFERDDFTCQYCGARGIQLECDHVIPVSHGGATTLINLVTACFPCNRAKGKKTMAEWEGVHHGS